MLLYEVPLIMKTSKDTIKKAIDELLAEPSPRKGDRLFDDLKPFEKSIRLLHERGWSISALVKRLKLAGVNDSQENIRVTLMKLLGKNAETAVTSKAEPA